MKFVSNFLLLPGFRRWINDGINVGITEGEVDGNTDGNEDGSKDGEDERNVVGNVDGIKDGIFEGWDEGTRTDGMMEVSMEKLKGNLLARKMETMKGQIVRKMDFYMVPLMEFKMVWKIGF